MQRGGEGSREIPVARRSRYGSTGDRSRCFGPPSRGRRRRRIVFAAFLCKASSAGVTACSLRTYRLMPPAVFDFSRRARQRVRSQRFNRNVYSI